MTNELENDIIDILNETIPSGERYSVKNLQEFELQPEDLYLDSNGLPTDKFLESLKRDFFMTKDIDDLKAIFQSSNSKTSSHNKHRYSKPISTSQSDRINNNSLSTRIKHRHSNKPTNKYDPANHDGIESDESSEASEYIEVTKDIQTNRTDNSFKQPNTNYISTPHKSEVSPSLEEILQKHHNNIVPDKHVESIVGDIGTEVKIKSLQLRVKGQFQTIKALESQLQEALTIIDLRNNELSRAQARLSSIEKRKLLSNQGISVQSSSHLKKAELLAQKYKLQNETLSTKLTDEQARRIRAEERLRQMKDQHDKIKSHNDDLEIKLSQHCTIIQSLETKIVKYKKETKMQAADVSVQKKIANDNEHLLASMKAAYDEAMLSIKKVQYANDNLIQDLQVKTSELSSANEHVRQLKLEIDILKEQLDLRKNIFNISKDSAQLSGAGNRDNSRSLTKPIVSRSMSDMGSSLKSLSSNQNEREYIPTPKNLKPHIDSKSIYEEYDRNQKARVRSRSISPNISLNRSRDDSLSSSQSLKPSKSETYVSFVSETSLDKDSLKKYETESASVDLSDTSNSRRRLDTTEKYNKLKDLYNRVNKRKTHT